MGTTIDPATAIQKKVDVSVKDGKSFSENVFFLEIWSTGNVTSEKTIEVKNDGKKSAGAFKLIQFKFDKNNNYIYTSSDINQKATYTGTASEFSISGLSAGGDNTVIRIGKTNSPNDVTEQYNGPAELVEVKVETVDSSGSESNRVIKDDGFWPQDAPIAGYGNQFIRHMSGKTGGTIEFNTPANSFPANAQLYFEAGVPANMKGMKDEGDEMTIIYKENHGNPKKDGKHNVKVLLEYQSAKGGKSASYLDKVELGAEDDHNDNEKKTPKEFKPRPTYQNTDVLKKYKAGDKPVRGRGSYQDTPDGGVRYKLEIQDPETREWKLIFDHADFGDDNHDIKNYRGKSAFRSSIRTDGSTTDDLDEKLLKPLQNERIDIKKSDKQQEELKKFASGNITFVEIEPDDGKIKPLSSGKK